MKRKMVFYLTVVALLLNTNIAITAMMGAERAEAKESPVIKAVAVGVGHSAAITEDGDLYCWGNYHFRFDGVDKFDFSSPVKILENIADVILCDESYTELSMAIAENGDLYCWGNNRYGEVGNGTKESQWMPEKILEDVETVSYENGRCAAITKNGDLYCWGSNSYGAIGNGRMEENQLCPVKVLENVKMVSLGENHSAAITKDGDLYCWGSNSYGQVGNGTTEKQLTPMKIYGNVGNILLCGTYTLAVTEKGDLYSWGYNNNGEIGNGTTVNQLIPIKILENVKTISSEAAITEKGDLYCWGYNDVGQVGNGTTEEQLTPMKVLENVEYIYSDEYGDDYKMAITREGDLYSWGFNINGMLGNGAIGENQLSPVKVLENVKTVFVDDSLQAVITESGDLYCWGHNYFGQIGNGTTKDQLTPIKILENVRTVSLSLHSAAITNNGDLYCWGYNYEGQVGNGTHEEDVLYPVNITEYFNSESLPDISDTTPTEPTEQPFQLQDGYLTGLKLSNNTVDEIYQQLGEENVVCKSAKGEELSENDLLGTGSIVCITDSDRTVTEYEVILVGDIYGDGKIDSKDVSYLARYRLGKESLSDAQLAAADVYEDGKVDSKDVSKLARYRLGKDTISSQ